jgi:hypothetical protein
VARSHSAGGLARSRWSAAAILCALLTSSAWGAVTPSESKVVLQVGEVRAFDDAQGVESSFDVSLGPFSGPATAILGTDLPLETPLSSFVCARQRLSRARAEILRFNEFSLDSSWDSETVIPGRVTGSIDVRGFLLLLGVGQAKVEVVAELLDTTDPERTIVVNCKEISKHRVNSAMKPSVDVSLKVEGGAPYIGGGLGIGTGNLIHYELLKVRDSVDFGFDVMLRRGHSYRLVVKCKSESMLTAAGLGLGAAPLGGKSIACFFSPEDLADPDVFVPNILANHFDRLEEIVQLLALPTDGTLHDVPLFNIGQGDDLPDLIRDILEFLRFTIESQAGTISNLLRNEFGLDLPTNVDLCSLASSFFDLSDRLLGEEQIDTPGVKAKSLTVSLGQDSVEIAERQQIESGLMNHVPAVLHVLPAASGGQLEKVLYLVDERIAQTASAGLPTNNAPYFMNLARAELTQGAYRTAWSRANTAYRLLTPHD